MSFSTFRKNRNHSALIRIPTDQAYPGYYEMRYRYKLMLNFPDGSSHEMRPNGWSDGNSNDPLGDWFDIGPMDTGTIATPRSGIKAR